MSRLPHCEGYESVYCAPGVCFAPWQRSALPKLSPMHHEKLDMIRSPTNNDEVEAGLKPAKGASPPQAPALLFHWPTVPKVSGV
jgi:hypothetical protein